jgi:hypothetical protein
VFRSNDQIMSNDSNEQGQGDPAPTMETADPEESEEPSVEALRTQVEEKYDFDDFGPKDMDQMTAEEWDAAFDIDTWITGQELLDRVEADVKQRVVDRDVFARVERLSDPHRLIAYSDEGYAVVYQDGTITGEGTVLRDVKPSVALCSMEDYDPPEMPEGEVLPDPSEITEGSGDLGHQVLQIVGGLQVLAGIVLFVAGVIGALGKAGIIGIFAGLGFIVIGIVLFLLVANARLSDRFRAEEYRDRLRAVGAGTSERPEILEEIAKRSEHDDSNDTPPRL